MSDEAQDSNSPPATVRELTYADVLEQHSEMHPILRGHVERLAAEEPAQQAEHSQEAIAERVRTLFTPEHLATLSLEEYVDLLRQFPQHSDLVAHVVRQGVRDHSAGPHKVGIGEFHNSFKKVLASKRLRSFVDMAEEELFFDESGSGSGDWIRQWASDVAQNNSNAEEGMHDIAQDLTYDPSYNRHEVSYFVDKRAVHFCINEVGDAGYGGETGNETFVVFPALFIASQYNFQGLSENVQDNDNWVWAPRGIPTEAGIVFLPKSSRVNPETGSRYELDERGNPIINQELINQLINVASHEDLPTLKRSAVDSEKNEEDRKTAFGKLLGINNQAVIEYFYNNPTYLVGSVRYQEGTKDELLKDQQALTEHIKNVLADIGKLYVEPEATISGQEYWEAYFESHPEQRPVHIVFFEGEPTEALQQWRSDQGLVSVDAAIGRPKTPNPFGTEGADYGKLFPKHGEAVYKSEVRKGEEFFYHLILGVIRRELEERAKQEP